MSAGLMKLISWDKIDGYFMRGSFASGGESTLNPERSYMSSSLRRLSLQGFDSIWLRDLQIGLQIRQVLTVAIYLMLNILLILLGYGYWSTCNGGYKSY